jgi:hypothetical protein
LSSFASNHFSALSAQQKNQKNKKNKKTKKKQKKPMSRLFNFGKKNFRRVKKFWMLSFPWKRY